MNYNITLFIEHFYIIRYKNRPHMTFDDINSKAEQTFILNRDPNGQLEYPLRYVYFIAIFITFTEFSSL